MKTLQTSVLLLALALYVQYSHQQPPCMEQQTDGSVGTGFDISALLSNEQSGQWFTAACSGVLANFAIRIGNTGPIFEATVEARLYAGRNWPTNPDLDDGLGVVTTVVASGAARGTRIDFDFSPLAPALDGGSEYTIRLRIVAGGPLFQIDAINTNPYPNGNALAATEFARPSLQYPSSDLTFEYSIAAPAAVAQGDPHLVGLRGQHYDFNGRANAIFNLLTSPILQVNSLFTEMEITPTFFQGTYLQTISIQAHGVLSHPIVIGAGNSSFVDHPSLRFGVGENAVEFEATPNNNTYLTRRNTNVLVKTKAVEVTWTATETTATALGIADNHNDRVVRVAVVTIIDVAVIEVFCVENGYGVLPNGTLHRHFATARRNLDVRIRLLKNNMHVHGVIGATNDATVARPPGDDEDYEVKDGLLGTDFIHNLYPHNTN